MTAEGCVTPPEGPRELPRRDGPHYPQARSHEWGCFAALAIEFDGYCNVEVIAPWNGRVLFVPDAADGEMSMADTLRKVADAIESAGWLADLDEEGH